MEKKTIRALISTFTLVAFMSTGVPSSYAQRVVLPAPGTMVSLSKAFSPPLLKGIKVYPENPFRFDFILDKGDIQQADAEFKDESSKLIRYFLASLTVPEKDLWVNLSPYEKDRIVPIAFGQTGMGRDLLAQDYLLKQITASLIYPESETGRNSWKQVYAKAKEHYGTTDIPVDTFNKVWIVPEKAVVYESANAGTAYVVESHLKVMLEDDYWALQKNAEQASSVNSEAKSNETQELAKNVIREIVLPELEREVNEGKNFAALRQVYQSLILAVWFKKKIKESLLDKVYIDRNKIAGVNIDDPKESESIWTHYVEAFKKGTYNFIKEEEDRLTGEVIARKYFSGGVDASMLKDQIMMITHDNRSLINISDAPSVLVKTRIDVSAPASVDNSALTAKEFVPVVAAYLKDYKDHQLTGIKIARMILNELIAAGVDPRYYQLFREPYMLNWHRSFAAFYRGLKKSMRPNEPLKLRAMFIAYLGKATIFRADVVPNASVLAFSQNARKNGFQSKFRSMRIDQNQVKSLEASLFRKYGIKELVSSSMQRLPLPGLENGVDGRKALFISVSVVDRNDPDPIHAEAKAEAYAREVAATFKRAYLRDNNLNNKIPLKQVYKNHTIVVHKARVDRFYLVQQAGAAPETEAIARNNDARKGVRLQLPEGRTEYVDMNNDLSLENMIVEIPPGSVLARTTYNLNEGIGHYPDITEETKPLSVEENSFWKAFSAAKVASTFALEGSLDVQAKAWDFMQMEMAAKSIPAGPRHVAWLTIEHVARAERRADDPDLDKKEAVYWILEKLKNTDNDVLQSIHGIDWDGMGMTSSFDRLKPERKLLSSVMTLPDSYHAMRYNQYRDAPPKEIRPTFEEIAWGIFHEIPRFGNDAPDQNSFQAEVRRLAKMRYGWLTNNDLALIVNMIEIKEIGHDGHWMPVYEPIMILLEQLGIKNGIKVKTQYLDMKTGKMTEGVFQLLEAYTSGLEWKQLHGHPDDSPPTNPIDMIAQLNAGDIAVLNSNANKADVLNGGIDLTPAYMNLQTQNSSGEIQFQLNPAQLLELQNAPGFTPVIIDIQSLKDLKIFLGANGTMPNG